MGAATAAGKTIRVPADYGSIQTAVDNAEHGDTVLVGAGSYNEHIVLKEGVCLRSEGDDSPGKQEYGGRKPLGRAERTIIDVKSSTKAAVVAGADGATLDGFTIVRGNANGAGPESDGAGIYNSGCSAMVVANCIFNANLATDNGRRLGLTSHNPSFCIKCTSKHKQRFHIDSIS